MSRPQPMRFRGLVAWDKDRKRYRLSFNNGTYLLHYLARFKGPVVVEIQSARKIRSYKQNNRYWGAVISTALDEAAEFTGHTKDELHEIFKQKYLKPKIVKFQGKDFPIWTTKNLTVGEFVEYCMKVEKDLAEMGIRIPTPEEHYKGI